MRHGDQAEGSIGPNLQGDRLDALEQHFAGGAVHQGKTLSDQQIADVAEWLATLP